MTAVVAAPARELAGLGEIVRLIVRRDRWPLLAYVVLLPLLGAGLAAGSATAYPTEADRIAAAAGIAVNPALLATRGPVFAPTAGGLVAQGFASSGALLAGAVSLLLVIRHTRSEERAGRRELLGSTVLGRHAPLAAALVVVVVANLVLAAVAAVLLAAAGLPVAGSVALGLALGGNGIVFAGVGALAAQVTGGAGGARGIALAVLGAALVVAGSGEVARSGLVWWSPIGWSRHLRAFAGEQWWVLLLFVALTAALVAAAVVLSGRRDVGAGLVPARLGPAGAAPSLRSPLALAWRLHRGAVVAWTVGFVAFGTLLGTAMRSVGGLFDTPAYRDLAAGLGGGDPAGVLFQLVLYVLTQVTAASVVASALQVRSEESDGRADLLLGGPVARRRWALAHIAVTVVGAVAVLAGFGLAAGIGYGTPATVLGTTLAYLPAVLVFGGLAVALYGWAPRLAVPVTWTVLGLAVGVDFLAEFRVVDRAALAAVSPFAAIATPLGAGTGLVPALVTVTVIAVGLAWVGLVGLRRRDLGG